MSKRLLLICSETFPGSYKVITNLTGVLKNLVKADILPIERQFVFRPNIGIKRVKRRLQKIQVDLKLLSIDTIVDYGNNILFAAWSPIYDVLLKKLNKKGITPSLIMCSTPGQSELSRHELVSYHKIIEYVRTGRIQYWLLNKRLYDSIGKIIKQAIYFPHTIDLEQFNNIKPTKLKGKNIDLFCTTRLGKNILNQIVAFKISAVPATLHINFSHKLFNPLIKDINAQIVSHKWIDESKYYNLVAAMDLSLQATFSESFNYAVAERMCLGVPVITSYDIYLVAEDPLLSKNLCIKALDTPSEIARLIKAIAKDDKLRLSLGEQCRIAIERIAHKNNKEARDFIIDAFL